MGVLAEGEASAYNEKIRVCEDFPMPRPLPLRPLQGYDLTDGSTFDNLTTANVTEELDVLYINRSPCIPWPNPPLMPPTNSTPQEERSESQNFLERLWAYLTIEDLLDEKISKVEKYKMLEQGSNNTDEVIANKTRLGKAKALKLALNYNFVTQLTSLIVVQPDNFASQENTTSKMTVIDPIPVEEISRYSRVPTSYRTGWPLPSGSINYRSYSRSASMSANPMSYNAPNARMGVNRMGLPGPPGPSMGLSGPPVRRWGKTVVSKTSGSGVGGAVKSRSRSYTPSQSMIVLSDKKSHSVVYQTTSRPVFTATHHDSWEDDDDYYLDDLTSAYPILKDCEINLYPKTYLRGSKTTITNKMNSTVTDLSLHSFNDKLKSLEVKGPCCWRIFAYKHFRGPSKQFCNGKFKSSTMIGADLVGLASSLIILVS